MSHHRASTSSRATGTTVAIVGSPNAGKTTLFNALRGLRSKTADYPGVTVSRREGTMHHPDGDLTLVDLPGTNSLVPISPDERIVLEALGGQVAGVEPPDALLVVADATTLERSLLLVSEVLSLGRPTALVLTMIDEVAARHGAVVYALGARPPSSCSGGSPKKTRMAATVGAVKTGSPLASVSSRSRSISRTWPALAFGSMFALAYVAALVARSIVSLVGG